MNDRPHLDKVRVTFRSHRGLPLTDRLKPRSDHRSGARRRHARIMVICAVIIVVSVIAAIAAFYNKSAGGKPFDPVAPPSASAPIRPGSYLGVYAPGVPGSYAGIRSFSEAAGIRPGVVVYYSGWQESFQARFAATVVRHHAVPLVQIDPTGISLAAIASGQYDAYLRSYATAVKAFGYRVILSFGHEMNGHWYSWAHGHASPAMFVAAWRHIVSTFRRQGATNVTWLWTVNVIDSHAGIPSPARWWPGSSYVTWVGIDGYYLKPSSTFASLFGPTIKVIRALTLDRILISETSAPAADQPAKIADLVSGVRAYGLLGFVWFDAKGKRDWRLSGQAAFAAFRRGAGG
jgi:mannan endo-1,4-beta-mannosidase